MKLSEYIEQLQAIYRVTGDVNVMGYFGNSLRPAAPPRQINLRKMNARESVQRAWESWDAPELKGELVVQV